jgi:hypothetical protein
MAIEKKVILSYDASSVKWHYQRQGYIVMGVEKGDYRKAQNARPRTGAKPDMASVREAIDQLGIRLPVRIHESMRQGGAQGHHILRKDRQRGDALYHDIMLKGWLTAEQMGRTLWHELAHCVQSESFLASDDPQRAWRMAYRDGTSYRMKRWERDAREHEALNDDLPLCR